jgi:hypothetical protein
VTGLNGSGSHVHAGDLGDLVESHLGSVENVAVGMDGLVAVVHQLGVGTDEVNSVAVCGAAVPRLHAPYCPQRRDGADRW